MQKLRVLPLAAALAGLLMLPAGAPAADKAKTPSVVPAKGWHFSVYAENLPMVENVTVNGDGIVYATLEDVGAKGQVVRIRNPKQEVLLSELNHPDGIVPLGKLLIVTEEADEGRVLEINPATGEKRVLATLYNPEGIAVLPDGDLVISEDSVNGRLVRLNRQGKIETILGGLNRPEGLCVARDGTIYFAETATGRVLAFKDGVVRSVVVDLDEPDQLKLAPDGALWITEDSVRGRLLRLKDGALHVILSGLVYPQGMAFLPNGNLLLAERGRSRLLQITREIDQSGGYLLP
jgi:sugar lactone lactonase YvrE